MTQSILNVERKEYTYTWPKDSMKKAIIRFEKHGNEKWDLDRAEYTGQTPYYKIDMWNFLGDLAQEVERIYQELRK